MEPAIRSQFSSEILDEALSRYGIEPASVRELAGFESFVYECTHGGQDRILRISHSLHRNAEAIAGELDWIGYLAANGVRACPAVASRSDNLLEVLGDGSEYFTAAVFDKALGGPADGQVWQSSLFEEMGLMMGRMHALAKRYAPSNPSFKRPEWHEDVTGIAERFLPADQKVVVDRFNSTLSATHALPKDADSYGLVHLDFHRGNFFVDDGRIYLFDFDDCQYSWFADDIAMALFYAVPHDCSSARDRESARAFMHHFLTGYRTQNKVGSDWIARVPMFLKRREFDLYTVIHRSMDLDHLDAWATSFMNQRRFNIEHDVPYVDIDFAAL